MIELADVEAAAARLAGVAHRTPVLRSRLLDEAVGAEVHLKAECFQRTGTFKFRGAYNAIVSLTPEERARGVVAFSSGNHAQAVARAAALLGTSATILMPLDAPAVKVAATRSYGAEVVTYDRYGGDREDLGRELTEERGGVLIPPFDHPMVIAGQGTVALELLDEVGALDGFMAPVGGGGLLAGCATVVRARAPGATIVGVEPEAGDDVRQSMAAGERVTIAVPRTIADGQQTTAPGRLTFPVLQARVDRVVTVGDDEIVDAMALLFDRLKVVVEPSGACALAAALVRLPEPMRGGRVGVVLSGGNVGIERFVSLMAARAGP